jgi:hypothetical protein
MNPVSALAVTVVLVAGGAAIAWWGYRRHQRWLEDYVARWHRLPPQMRGPHMWAMGGGGLLIVLGAFAALGTGLPEEAFAGIVGTALLVGGLSCARAASRLARSAGADRSPSGPLGRVLVVGYVVATIGVVLVVTAVVDLAR